MPIIRTMPKRGFSARGKIRYQVVNLRDLERLGDVEAVTVEALHKSRLVSSSRKPVKILGEGDVTKKLLVKVHAASRVAQEKLSKAGGSVELIKE